VAVAPQSAGGGKKLRRKAPEPSRSKRPPTPRQEAHAPKPLPARPGGPKALGSDEAPAKRRTRFVRLAEFIGLVCLAGVLYFPVSYYLKTGRPLDPFGEDGKAYILEGVAKGRKNLRASYGYIKSRVPRSTGDLEAWLKARGESLPDTEDLLAMASEAAAKLDNKARPDGETSGDNVKVSDEDRARFKREQELRASRLKAKKDAAERKKTEERFAAELDAARRRAEERKARAAGKDPAPPAVGENPQLRGEPVAKRPPPEIEVASADSRPVETAPVETAPQREEQPPAVTRRAPRPASNPDLEKGRKLYEQGLSHFRNTRPANPKWQEELAVAGGLFTEAQGYLARAHDADPNNAAIEELQTNNNRFLYDCMKRKTLKLR